MRAAVFMGKEDVRLMEVEAPKPGPEDVLIRVAYCGICGSDVAAFKTGNYPLGLIIGHEFSGIVEHVGEAVEGISKGDRVTGNGFIPCGKCRYCMRGLPTLCSSLNMTGITINGALAEYICLPSWIVYKLPGSLPLLDASLVDPLSNVLHSINLSSFKPGCTALIQGFGPMGALTFEVLKASGSGKILVSEVSDGRRELAKDLGADVVIDPASENLGAVVEEETEGEGVDLVFDTTGSPQALSLNFTLARKGGEIVVVGIAEEPVMSDFFTLVLNELTVKGSYGGFNEYPDAIRWLAEGRIRSRRIITSVIGLSDITEGFKSLINPTRECKVVVRVAGG